MHPRTEQELALARADVEELSLQLVDLRLELRDLLPDGPTDSTDAGLVYAELHHAAAPRIGDGRDDETLLLRARRIGDEALREQAVRVIGSLIHVSRLHDQLRNTHPRNRVAGVLVRGDALTVDLDRSRAVIDPGYARVIATARERAEALAGDVASLRHALEAGGT